MWRALPLQERCQASQTNFRRDSCCMAQASSACTPNSILKVCCLFLCSHSTLTCLEHFVCTRISIGFVMGNPRVNLGPPTPNPHETRTRSHGSGFIRVWVWVPVTSHHITHNHLPHNHLPHNHFPPLLHHYQQPHGHIMTTRHDVTKAPHIYDDRHDNVTQHNEGRGKRCGQGWAVMPIPNNWYEVFKFKNCCTNYYTTFAGTTTWPGGFTPPHHVEQC